jgi:hypothetical protein
VQGNLLILDDVALLRDVDTVQELTDILRVHKNKTAMRISGDA